jgi:hypothetical protein
MTTKLDKAKKLIKSYGINYFCDKRKKYFSLKPYGNITNRDMCYLISKLVKLADKCKIISSPLSCYYCIPFKIDIEKRLQYSYRFLFNIKKKKSTNTNSGDDKENYVFESELF